jgi:segregation and condensation protein A
MAEQTMAERPKGERLDAPKTAPWWQRILRRAVDGLRSGFGLFKRSSAGKSETGTESAGSEVEAADTLSMAPEPQEPLESEAQIEERDAAEEETNLSQTFPNPESNNTAAEKQAVETAPVENTHQPEAETFAADEAVAPNGAADSAGANSAGADGPGAEGADADGIGAEDAGADDSGAKGMGFSPYIDASIKEGALAPEVTPAYEPGASAEPEPVQIPVAEPNEAAFQMEELQIDAKDEGITLNENSSTLESNSEVAEEQIVEPEISEVQDAISMEAEPPELEAREPVEPIADPPSEEAIIAESEAVADAAVELPAETDATEGADASEPAQPVEFVHEEPQSAASEDTATDQATHAPEEVIVMESAEPDGFPEEDPVQENAIQEYAIIDTMDAAPDQQETRAEADSANEPELASPESVSEAAPVFDQSKKNEAFPAATAEELPAAQDASSEEIPVPEETNIGAEGILDAEPAESPDALPAVSDTMEPPASESQEPVAEPETTVVEPETPVVEPSTSEQEAVVAVPVADAAEPEAAAPVSETVVAEPDTTAKPEAPVAEPVSPETSPVPAEPTPEERKKAEKVAAAMKARSQTEEQSPFSVMVGQLYEGPLDLLLDLIRKQDIDIYDIPIAKITAQFLAYVNHLRASDMDVAGDFIYTAALLIHIKSKMLLPRDPAGPDDAAEDPRHELVERLLEHERFKNAAQMLQQKQLLEAATWTRSGMREFGEEANAEPEIAADTVDLVRIFREVLDRARNRPVMNLEEDSVTVGQMIRFLSRRLTMDDRPVALRRLLSQSHSERMLIAMFLALLEMVRLQAILLRQDRQFSEIFIKKHTGFDALLNEDLDNAKDDWR